MKINLDCYGVNFGIEPFSYDDAEDKIYCELKLNFASTPDELIKFLTLYKELGNIQKQAWTPDDEWRLQLEFKGFKER